MGRGQRGLLKGGDAEADQIHCEPDEDGGDQHKARQGALPWEGDGGRRGGFLLHAVHHCGEKAGRGDEGFFGGENPSTRVGCISVGCGASI